MEKKLEMNFIYETEQGETNMESFRKGYNLVFTAYEINPGNNPRNHKKILFYSGYTGKDSDVKDLTRIHVNELPIDAEGTVTIGEEKYSITLFKENFIGLIELSWFRKLTSEAAWQLGVDFGYTEANYIEQLQG